MAAYGSTSKGGASFTQGSSWSIREPSGVGHVPAWARGRHRQEPPLRRFIDSFKRDPARRISTHGIYGHGRPDQYRDNSTRAASDQAANSFDPSSETPREQNHRSHYYDLHAANVRTANTSLVRELKGRHLQMIAIGGSVGMFCFCQKSALAFSSHVIVFQPHPLPLSTCCSLYVDLGYKAKGSAMSSGALFTYPWKTFETLSGRSDRN